MWSKSRQMWPVYSRRQGLGIPSAAGVEKQTYPEHFALMDFYGERIFLLWLIMAREEYFCIISVEEVF